MKNVGIIGGGIIGLCSAYYLNKSGHKVTIIDQGDLKDGCSFGNAGMIVPSHFIPLAAPGMIAKGIRWMFNSSSPFYVKPRFDFDLLKWGYQFYKNSNQDHVRKSAIALKEISLLSKTMYQQLAKELPFDFDYHERGLMMLYKTREAEHEVKVDVQGGIYFPGDAHLTPQALMAGLKGFLKDKVAFHLNTEVTGFDMENAKIKTIKTAK